MQKIFALKLERFIHKQSNDSCEPYRVALNFQLTFTRLSDKRRGSPEQSNARGCVSCTSCFGQNADQKVLRKAQCSRAADGEDRSRPFWFSGPSSLSACFLRCTCTCSHLLELFFQLLDADGHFCKCQNAEEGSGGHDRVNNEVNHLNPHLFWPTLLKNRNNTETMVTLITVTSALKDNCIPKDHCYPH